ncbi:tRNA-specific adenosine deaminase 1 isoform X5 [Vidua chalybeata]|uniref:tRNA-specific adenosine deaminase 1 isoform X5 n=1 Tax=Vidua chalybeata TaxID=81927 RepID=UPI0023A85EE9|nr:tRNA-specific adenosine deaminase 1 isoform X5 [Vidua chalybeata]
MWSADEIAGLCYLHYRTRLPKQGKPDPNREWTSLAAVVQVESAAQREALDSPGNLQVTKEVVAMGTGTKCIGQNKMRKTGDILNDSHAEIVAKRSFQRYLLHQLWLAASHQQCIFSPGTETGKWKLKPNIIFIFFSSHTPCGDASIFPISEPENQLSKPLTEGYAAVQSAVCRSNHNHLCPEDKRKSEKMARNYVIKRMKTDDGGCFSVITEDLAVQHGSVKREDNTNQKSYECSAEMQTANKETGLVRPKYPVYLSAVIVGKCPYSQEAMRRAVIERCQHISSLPDGFFTQEVKLLQSGLQFEHSRQAIQEVQTNSKTKLVPCSAAISWSAVPEQPLDVTSDGFRQGTTKKGIGSRQSRSKICKVEFFHKFQKLVTSISQEDLPDTLRMKTLKTYWDYKEAALNYQEAWRVLRSQALLGWVKNAKEYLHFT